MWDFASEDRLPPWNAVSSPVSTTLRDAALTAQGACAVGTGGVVIARSPDGTWGVIVGSGPSARGESLFGVAVTDDGERIWVAGANGALGLYDVTEGVRVDHSEPDGVSDAFNAITVAGTRGSEKLLVADGNGRVYPATVSNTSLNWGYPTRPAGDTAVTALTASADGIGYAADSDGAVWQTTARNGWERIGIDGAQNSLYAVAVGPTALFAGGGNGRVYRARQLTAWTPFTLGNVTVKTLTAASERALAGGTNGGLYTYVDGRWHRGRWNGSKTIHGVVRGDPDVAVGASGLILERSAGATANQS